MKDLRPYQRQAIAQTMQHLSQGLRVLLAAFCGWGKSFFTSTLTNAYMATHAVILAVKTRDLVQNLSDELTANNVEHGVFMAGHELFNPSLRVQACSIDTLRSRAAFPFVNEENVLIILDEAHDSKSDSYQNFINAYKSALIVGVTATPYNGLTHFDVVVQTIKPHELRDQGFLVPFEIYAPVRIDTSKVDLVAGEYHQGQLYDVAKTNQVIGNIVNDWKALAEYRPTLLFAVNVQHSKQICERFNAEGIPARHIDAESTREERDQAHQDLINGRIRVITNVRLWTTGKNIPQLGCIQDCSPTKSVNLFIQKDGRGTRTNDIFKDCIIIDNAGNVCFHGDPYAERPISLDYDSNVSKKNDEVVEKLQTCKVCFRAFTPGPSQCPYCGNQRAIKVPRISEVDGKLCYLTEEDFARIELQKMVERAAAQRDKFCKRYRQLGHIQRNFKKRKLDRSFIYNKLIKEYGIDYCKNGDHGINFPNNIIEQHSFSADDQLDMLGIGA